MSTLKFAHIGFPVKLISYQIRFPVKLLPDQIASRSNVNQ